MTDRTLPLLADDLIDMLNDMLPGAMPEPRVVRAPLKSEFPFCPCAHRGPAPSHLTHTRINTMNDNTTPLPRCYTEPITWALIRH